MDSSVNEMDCRGYKYLQFGFTFVDGGVLLLNSFLLYQFISRYASKKQIYTPKPPKALYYTALALAIVIISLDIILVIVVLKGEACIVEKKAHDIIVEALMMFFYIIQSYLLSMIVFMTLRYSFQDSVFAVQKSTVNMFKVAYVLIPLLAIAQVLTSNAITFVVFCLVLIALFVSLIALFIRKLITIYKNLEAETLFIEKITKLTALNMISILLTLVMPLLVIIIDSTNTSATIGSGGMLFCMLLDTTTNLWCIVMTFTYFTDYYSAICRCTHRMCRSFWSKCIGEQERILAKINEETAHSGSGNISSQNKSGITMELSIDRTQTRNETQTVTEVQMQSQSSDGAQSPQSRNQMVLH